jgi:hypothetical protein
MRSDWEPRPDGIRIVRGAGPRVPAFAIDRVQPFTGLTVTRSGDELAVRFENTLGRRLAAPVLLVLHYEGCFGKPGTVSSSLIAEAGLTPGQTLTGTLPAYVLKERVPGLRVGETARHRAQSVEVRAAGAGVVFDFDVGLDALGVDVDCPAE